MRGGGESWGYGFVRWTILNIAFDIAIWLLEKWKKKKNQTSIKQKKSQYCVLLTSKLVYYHMTLPWWPERWFLTSQEKWPWKLSENFGENSLVLLKRKNIRFCSSNMKIDSWTGLSSSDLDLDPNFDFWLFQKYLS